MYFALCAQMIIYLFMFCFFSPLIIHLGEFPYQYIYISRCFILFIYFLFIYFFASFFLMTMEYFTE